MGTNLSYCSCCRDNSHKRCSEDFEMKKTDNQDKYPEFVNTSKKSLSLDSIVQEKSEVIAPEEISSIDFYSNSSESSNIESHQSIIENKVNIKQTLSLNTINEITDSEINEFLVSNLQETDELSKINLTIPNNSSLEYIMRPHSHIQSESFYRGESDSQGRPHGRGIKVDKNGKYIGYFYEGVPHGMGRLVATSGDIYQGEFHKGKLHGNAVCVTQDGIKYEGAFKKGLLTGSGREIWLNGTEYEGEYYKNMHHGKGKLKLSDNSLYIGEFHSDRAFGKGKKVWEDSSFYEGDWKDNLMHGQGEYHWKDGTIYEGQYLNNLIHGSGKLILSNKKIFEGEWKQMEDGKIIYFDKKNNKEKIIDFGNWSALENKN